MKSTQQQFETSNIHLNLVKDCDGVYLIPETRFAWVNWVTAYSFGREEGRMIEQDEAAKTHLGQQVPHITHEEWLVAVAALPKDHDLRPSEIANKALELKYAAGQPLISAEEARKLGAGNAEFRRRLRNLTWSKWHVCGKRFDKSTEMWEVQYRAIKQSERLYYRPGAGAGAWIEWLEGSCITKNHPAFEWSTNAFITEPVEPHAELKALYAQQVKDGTLGNFVWEFFYNGLSYTEWRTIIGEKPQFMNNVKYRCTPKPTCQVRNDDTGELKTMTREAAKLLQAETKDVCDWFTPTRFDDPQDFILDGVYTYKRKANLVKLDGKFITELTAITEATDKLSTHDVWYKYDKLQEFEKTTICFNPHTNQNFEYQLRPKPIKQVSWKDIPVGVMTNKGELRFVNPANNMACCERGEKSLNNWVIVEQLTLAPASEQHWIVKHGTNPKDIYALKGIDVTCKYVNSDLFLFKVTGIAEGYELK